MEEAFTRYLKSINALLEPICVETDVKKGNFEYEASVIIPVRNRARTIDDAIRSALAQETRFPFNIIIVDNHSTDGTTEIIGQYKDNKAVIHLQPNVPIWHRGMLGPRNQPPPVRTLRHTA